MDGNNPGHRGHSPDFVIDNFVLDQEGGDAGMLIVASLALVVAAGVGVSNGIFQYLTKRHQDRTHEKTVRHNNRMYDVALQQVEVVKRQYELAVHQSQVALRQLAWTMWHNHGTIGID